MAQRIAAIILLAGGTMFLTNGQASAQSVSGSGTPGRVPVWTGDGTVLTDSDIQDNGTTVNVALPVQVSGSGTGSAISGFNPTGTGVFGGGQMFGLSGNASGPIDGCCATGVIGSASNPNGIAIGVGGYVSTANGWGTQGLNQGGGTGVLAQSQGGHGLGLLAQSDGGNAIFGTSQAPGFGSTVFLINNGGGVVIAGQGCSTPDPSNPTTCATAAGSFSVSNTGDANYSGDLTIGGNAFKPGGGPWSVSSDRRLKKSIYPIKGALHQMLALHGVTYEYIDAAAIHELPGVQMGMVAQDVEHVFPEWVDTGRDGYKRLTPRGFEALAVEAARELDAKSIEAMTRIADLERQNAQLRHAIDVLSEQVKTLQQAASSRTR